MKLLKKGQVGGLQGFILSIITIAIVLAIGLIVLSELQIAEGTGNYCQAEGDTSFAWNSSSMLCHNTSDLSDTVTAKFTAAYNSTGSIIEKMATIPTWIGIIIIVALAFIVLSFFIGRRQ